jgi:hypothetical protein
MSIPGNAYIAQTGGNFTAPASPAAVALAAATAKTVLAVTVGSANQPSFVELGFGIDGTSGSVLVELGLLTAATAGTTTALTPQQIRGWPAQASAQTAAFNYTAEPTAYATIARQWLLPMPTGQSLLQFPLGREVTGIVTAATAGKAVGVRVTSTIVANCRCYLEYEE